MSATRDTLDRRIRHAPPQPGERYRLVEDLDIPALAALGRHRVLSTPLLSHFTGRDHYNTDQRRFKQLYNGYCADPDCTPDNPKEHEHDLISHLARLHEQFNHIDYLKHDLVHSLTPYAQKELKNLGIPCLPTGGWFEHQLMGGFIGGSFEILAADHNLHYLSNFDLGVEKLTLPLRDATQEELRHQRDTGQRPDIPKVIPDALFALLYSNGKKRVFAREDDRGTESVEGKQLEATYIGKKLLNWIEVLRARRYKDVWGVDGLMIMVPVVDPRRATALMAKLKEYDERYAGHFIFKDFPQFGKHWYIPKDVLKDVYEPWVSYRGPFDITKP